MSQVHAESDTLREEIRKIESGLLALEGYWRRLQETVRAGKGSWQGDAAREQQLSLEEIAECMDQSIRRMRQFPELVRRTAGLTEEKLQMSGADSDRLPDDLL